jgi:hypothetical protein
MEINFNEQDIVDAVAIFVAQEERTVPKDVSVDLEFLGDRIAGKAKYSLFRTKELDEQDLIDAVAIFLKDYHNFDPNELQIELRYDEEIGINANVLVDNKDF